MRTSALVEARLVKGVCGDTAGLPRRWLVCRLSSLGDVVLATGVLEFLGRKYGWRFAVMTKAAFSPVFEQNPYVEKLLIPEPEQLKMPGLALYMRKTALAHQDWGLLDLHGSLRSTLLGFFWRGPKLRYPKFSTERRLFLRKRNAAARQKLLAAHIAQRYALAVEKVAPPATALLPHIFLSETELAWGAQTLAALQEGRGCLPLNDDKPRVRGVCKDTPAPGLTGAREVRLPLAAGCCQRDFVNSRGEALLPPVVLHPYATHRLKAWPQEHWRELIRLLEDAGQPWVVLGQGGGLCPENSQDLSNRTSLRELCALLGAAGSLGGVVVSGDSGPLHVATAVGTPVLGLYGPTSREWGFYSAAPQDRVLERALPCRPCSLHGGSSCPRGGECLRSISPAEVFQLLREMLAAPPEA